MAYLALYRKYRPQNFDDFVAQSEITQALRYQVKHATYAHSYIFSGIRGTGKTSMAKVFAKALNCLNPQEGSPCGVCTSCKALEDNAQMDIIEIDAASNNGVENIRELRENSHYLPAYSKVKVYIIDEVQMLSRGAYNALLKTLEEPSEQVVFILATTEIQKIPDTILSRCQQYQFRRISNEDMIVRMKYILEQEGYAFEESALDLIASHSGGALRDALSALDKVLAYKEDAVSEQAVENALGLLSIDAVDILVRNTLLGYYEKVIDQLDQLLAAGKQVDLIVEEMMHFLRAILVRRLSLKSSKIAQMNIERLLKDYEVFSTQRILAFLEQLDACYRDLPLSLSPRITLEILLLSSEEGNEKREEVMEKKLPKKEEKKPVTKIVQSSPPTKEEFMSCVRTRLGAATYALLLEADMDIKDQKYSISYPFNKEAYGKKAKNIESELKELLLELDPQGELVIQVKKDQQIEKIESFFSEVKDKLTIKP